MKNIETHEQVVVERERLQDIKSEIWKKWKHGGKFAIDYMKVRFERNGSVVVGESLQLYFV